MLKSLYNWCKKEIVLTIAIGLAIVSSIFVTTDKEYISYIDFRTLSILFCLMAVMLGLQKSGLGTIIASMASLISFKYIGKDYKGLRGKYLVYFTLANFIFLVVLFVLYYILVMNNM